MISRCAESSWRCHIYNEIRPRLSYFVKAYILIFSHDHSQKHPSRWHLAVTHSCQERLEQISRYVEPVLHFWRLLKRDRAQLAKECKAAQKQASKMLAASKKKVWKKIRSKNFKKNFGKFWPKNIFFKNSNFTFLLELRRIWLGNDKIRSKKIRVFWPLDQHFWPPGGPKCHFAQLFFIFRTTFRPHDLPKKCGGGLKATTQTYQSRTNSTIVPSIYSADFASQFSEGPRHTNFVCQGTTWATQPRGPSMCGKIRPLEVCTDPYHTYSQVTSGLFLYMGVLALRIGFFKKFFSKKFSIIPDRTKKCERLKIIEFSYIFNSNKREIK